MATTRIHWLTSLDDARSDARDQGRLVFIHLSPAACPDCRGLDQAVFGPTGAVAEHLSRRFVAVRLTRHGAGGGGELHDGMLVQDADGYEWARFAGHPSAATVVAHLCLAGLRRAVAAADFGAAHVLVGEALLATGDDDTLLAETLHLAAMVRVKCARGHCGGHPDFVPMAARELDRRFGAAEWARRLGA